MKSMDCNNMNEEHVCKLDECTCGYTKGKCDNMTCKNYSPIEFTLSEVLDSKNEGKEFLCLENNTSVMNDNGELLFRKRVHKNKLVWGNAFVSRLWVNAKYKRID